MTRHGLRYEFHNLREESHGTVGGGEGLDVRGECVERLARVIQAAADQLDQLSLRQRPLRADGRSGKASTFPARNLLSSALLHAWLGGGLQSANRGLEQDDLWACSDGSCLKSLPYWTRHLCPGSGCMN